MIAIRNSAGLMISRKMIVVRAGRQLSAPSRQTAKTVDHVGEAVAKMLNDIHRTEERSALSVGYLDQIVSDLEVGSTNICVICLFQYPLTQLYATLESNC